MESVEENGMKETEVEEVVEKAAANVDELSAHLKVALWLNGLPEEREETSVKKSIPNRDSNNNQKKSRKTN